MITLLVCFASLCASIGQGAAQIDAAIPQEELLGAEFPLANVVPPLFPMGAQKELPFPDEPFEEHVRATIAQPPAGPAIAVRYDANGVLHSLTEDGHQYAMNPQGQWEPVTGVESAPRDSRYTNQVLFHARNETPASAPIPIEGETIRAEAGEWCATESGLYGPNGRHSSYGVDGPLSTVVTALLLDAKGTLWVGTSLGLTRRDPDGTWTSIQGRDGLPVEDITCIARDGNDRLWLGTNRGVVQYRPYEQGRQWFYRGGPRYVPDDAILDIAVSPDGNAVCVATPKGLGLIEIRQTNLLERAQTIERRLNERHRRLGLVAACNLDNAENPTSHEIPDNDNDGLWTAYHVAAMSLCYAATGDPAAKESAAASMHALYMLQNASGTPGLVARSVVPLEIDKSKDPQWRLTPDGKMYWKSDTSSDEIDGHYLAFYTYWEHVARHEPEERDLLVKQIRALTDYIVDNGYVLLDWDGKRTTWGFWSPELLNNEPHHYIENGLNSLQMLSFLKVAWHITGDAKYKEHYRKLIVDHGYLSNVLLSKKVFPDENNHSDDQLGFVAWYPILQLERDPAVRNALHAGVRRHYLVVEQEQPSFYIFAYATIDPRHADIAAGVENLRQIPTDRRQWAVTNSRRDDITWDPRPNRFDKRVLTHVLPADERHFAKWNGDPFVPDEPGDGRHEDDGAAYLLPYWMARYHGFLK